MAQDSFVQILTMVILMGIGILCCKIKLLNEETGKRLSSFVVMIVMPVVIFLSYQREFTPELLNGLIIALGLSVLSYTISIVTTHIVYRTKGGNNFGVEKFTAAYSNCAFIGIPLVYSVFGSEGVFYGKIYFSLAFCKQEFTDYSKRIK